MKKTLKSLGLFAALSLIITVQSSYANAENLEALLNGKSASLKMTVKGVPSDKLPDGITFRENGGSNIADFMKSGSDKKRKFLWEDKSGKFCMKPLLQPGGDFACYNVSKSGKVVTFAAQSKGKNQPEQMIVTFN